MSVFLFRKVQASFHDSSIPQESSLIIRVRSDILSQPNNIEEIQIYEYDR
jgi:hypothetical protein